MGCGSSLLKIILFIFNFAFAICGLALLTMGVLILKDVKENTEFLDDKFAAPPIFLIVVGSIIFIVSFCGFCGALKESHCMLMTYAVLLLIIFVVQVVAASLALAFRDDTKDIWGERLERYVKDYERHKHAVDSIQINLKCCGADGPGDYYALSYVPSSCCTKGLNSCTFVDGAYDTGCKQALEDFVSKQGAILGGVALGIAAVEIIGVIFGCCLARSVKNAERRAVV